MTNTMFVVIVGTVLVALLLVGLWYFIMTAVRAGNRSADRQRRHR